MAAPQLRPATRRVVGVALAGWLALIAAILLSPSDAAPSWLVETSSRLTDSVGVPAALAAPHRVEVGLNVLLFLPLSLLGWFVTGRRSVPFWLVVGLVVSAVIELAQLAIPGRVSTVQDVVANTAGAAIGAVFALGLTTWGKQGR